MLVLASGDDIVSNSLRVPDFRCPVRFYVLYSVYIMLAITHICLSCRFPVERVTLLYFPPPLAKFLFHSFDIELRSCSSSHQDRRGDTPQRRYLTRQASPAWCQLPFPPVFKRLVEYRHRASFNVNASFGGVDGGSPDIMKHASLIKENGKDVLPEMRFTGKGAW